MNRSGVRDPGGQPLPHHVVQAERALLQVEFQQTEPGHFLGQILRVQIVEAPKCRRGRQRNGNVFRKDGEFGETALVLLDEKLEGVAEHGRDGAMTRFGGRGVFKRSRALTPDDFRHALDRARRCLTEPDALPDHRGGEFEREGPLAEIAGEGGGMCRVDGSGELGEHRDGFGLAHLVHIDRAGSLVNARVDAGVARGKKTRGLLAASQKVSQVLRIPDIVDDDEAGTVSEFLVELNGCILDGEESRTVAGERGVSGAQSGDQVGGLAEGDPEDAAVEVRDDIVVVAEGCRERGLAEAARARERGGDGDGLRAVGAQEQVFQSFELCMALDEVRGQVGRHEGDAGRLARASEMAEEGGPFLIEVEAVKFAHPARHFLEIGRISGVFDGINADTLPAGVAPFFLHVARGERGRRHQEQQEVDVLDGFSDLFPPVPAAFQEEAVVFDDDVGGVFRQAQPEIRSQGFAVVPGVGEEDFRHLGKYSGYSK